MGILVRDLGLGIGRGCVWERCVQGILFNHAVQDLGLGIGGGCVGKDMRREFCLIMRFRI